jgi:hypothetical protein
MLGDRTTSVGQVLRLLEEGHQINPHGRYKILPKEQVGNATPLVAVSSVDAIRRLLPGTALELLGFPDFAHRPMIPRSIWQPGIQTDVFTSSHGGSICVRRDGYVLQVVGFLDGEEAFEVGIRDRRLDGNGDSGEQSPLNAFPVHHEQANGLCTGDLVAELSVYSTQPRRYLQPGLLREFISSPDQTSNRFIYPWSSFNPERFFPLWQQAFDSGLAPWQPSPPIKGLAMHFVPQAEILLTELGYHQVETVPAWFNVAKFFYNMKNGYTFVNRSHGDNFKAIETELSELAGRLSPSEDDRTNIPYGKEAWIVFLQSIPTERYLLDPRSAYREEYGKYYLGGYVFTNSPSATDYCARMRKKLNVA